MFKEAIIGFVVLCILWFLCRLLYKNNKKITALLTFLVLCIACLSNIIYNAVNIYPDFYMDIVNGRFRYGTFSENLFAYSDEFMFQDEIIFPVLRNRQVSLDEEAGFYSKFFNLYSDSVQTVPVDKKQRETILEHKSDFTFSHEFSCMGIMDYVVDSIPEELTASFDEEAYPILYINTDSLKGNNRLVVVMQPDYTVYVMSDVYYKEITGGSRDV